MIRDSNTVITYGRDQFCPNVARSRANLGTWIGANRHHIDIDIDIDEHAATEVGNLKGRLSMPTVASGVTIMVELSNERRDTALAGAGSRSSVRNVVRCPEW